VLLAQAEKLLNELY